MTITAQDIVHREVRYCVSSLVDTLARGYGTVDGSRGVAAHRDLCDLTEQAFELSYPVLDYEKAARDAGWTFLSAQDDHSEIFWHEEEERFESFDDWAECCDFERIEPYERDVFEHWIVSDWLADKLESKGEKVDRDFAGLTIWARTTTGQAIYCDSVIEEIAAELNAA